MKELKPVFKSLILLSLPIIVGHLSLMLISTGDTIVAGRHSTDTLAAIGLAVALANPVMMISLGFQFALSPLLAKIRGEGQDINQYKGVVVYYSLFISLIFSLVTLLVIPVVDIIDYGEKINHLIKNYLKIVSFSFVFAGIYQGVKEFYLAKENVFLANAIAVVGVFINIFLNFSLVFGYFGFPKLEEDGLAWASFGVRFFMAFIIMVFFVRKFNKADWGINLLFIKRAFINGLPIAISVFFEVSAFCVVSLLAGKFGANQAAANNIVLNLASLSFMIPLSLAVATSVKIGHAYGEKNYSKIILFSKVGMILSLTFMFLSGLTFVILPDLILKLFTNENIVLLWAGKLILMVALFQIFDGTQITLTGILRGLELNKESSIAVLIGYWLIGIPLGAYLAFSVGYESLGLWIGLAFSLIILSVFLMMIYFRKIKKIRLGIWG